MRIRLFSRISHCDSFLGDEQIAGFENGNPVAIVESEKTAILMSALIPDYNLARDRWIE